MLYETFKKSWKDIDFRLFIPVILLNVANIILFLLFFAFNGILSANDILMQSFEPLKTLTAAEFLGLLRSAKFVVSGIIFLILSFIISSSFIAMKFAMTSSIVKRKKLSTKEMLDHGLSDLFKVMSLRAIVFALIFVMGIVVLLAAMMISAFNASLAGVLMVALALIVSIIFGLGLLFRYAIMFMLETSPVNAVKKSFNYVFSHAGIVIIMVLLMFLVGFIPVILMQWLLTLSTAGFFAGLMTLLGIAYSLVIDIWSALFIFNVYNSDKNIH